MTTPNKPATENGKLQDVQLLRGMAICLVLFEHLSISATLLGSVSKKLADPFYWGVELFFVISGYVVTLSAQRKDWNAIEFIIKRLFRLYPAILTVIVLAFLTNLYFLYSPPNDWSKTFFPSSTKSFIDQSTAIFGGYFINISANNNYLYGAMWTLSVEFQFYAFFIVILILTNLLRINHAWIGLLVFGIAATVSIFCLGVRLGELFGIHLGVIGYITGYRFDFMAMGVMLAFIRRETIVRWGTRQPKYLPLIAVLLPCVILAFSRSPLVPQTTGSDSLEGWGMICTLVCCAYLVVVAASGRAWMVYSPIKKCLIGIGDVSFTLYLLHFTSMAWAWVVIYYLIPSAFTPVGYPVTQALLIIPLLGIPTFLIYRFIELPGIGYGAFLIKLLRRINSPVKSLSL